MNNGSEEEDECGGHLIWLVWDILMLVAGGKETQDGGNI